MRGRTIQVVGLQAALVVCTLASARADDKKPTAASVDPGTLIVFAQNREANQKTTWRPATFFTLRCPVAGGTNLVVEYLQGKKVLGSASSMLDECPAGNSYSWTSGPGFLMPDTVNLDLTGDIQFKIRLTNEDKQTDVTVYAGKFKVGKQKVDKFRTQFYIDYDWRLPIGFTEVDLEDRNAPQWRMYMWFRKDDPKGCLAHISYGGKEIEAIEGHQWAMYGTLQPSAYQWSLVQFSAGKITPFTSTKNPGKHPLAKNPGEYEVRVVCGDEVARYLKFTADDKGAIVDPAAKANSFGPANSLLAVAVMGKLDGKWDGAAWKAGIYGNPLKEFAPPKPGEAPPAAAGPMPTLVKTSVRVEAMTIDGPKPSFRPQIYFTLKGPLAAGNRIQIDWLLPGKKAWETQASDAVIGDDASVDFQGTGLAGREGGFPEFPREKGQTKPGEYGFRLRITNALAKSDVTLMTGTFKVGWDKAQNAFYVDQDAWLSSVLVYWTDNIRQKDSPELMLRVWFRHRNNDEECQVRVLYQGNEVKGTSNDNGQDSGADKAPYAWAVHWMAFNGVRARGKGSNYHLADKNPGEYEFKIACAGKLTRSGKFTVGEGGQILDPADTNGKNALGVAGVLVPVEIKGDYDGKIDRAAFKNGIYGNPLKGL